MSRRVPDHLPILDRALAGRPTAHAYVERELEDDVDLCDGRGALRPEAIGWARRPLWRPNLGRHHPLRKKRWSFWSWLDGDQVLSMTLADLDYGGLCALMWFDLASGDRATARWVTAPGGVTLPERIDASVAFHRRGIDYEARWVAGEALAVRIDARTGDGRRMEARLVTADPLGQESLNVVVPWSRHRFQLNAKLAALPTSGRVRVGDREWELDPAHAHAVHDGGRGVWPWRSCWNWGVATGVQGGVRLAVNMGGRWTTGTGSNENGVLVDGRLHKLSEDLTWEYDAGDDRRPWRVRAPLSGAIDLTLAPRHAERTRVGLGPLSTRGVCVFGRWSGHVVAGGRTFAVRELPGWAEEFDHRW